MRTSPDHEPEASFPQNRVLDRLRAGERAFGLTARVTRSIEILRIVRASGHDFLRIDTQHGIFDLETIARFAQMSLVLEVPAIVRVRGVADPDIALLLDAGIGGVIFPNIDTAADARLAVASARFPPLGQRSYGGSYPHFDFRRVPVGDALRHLDAATLVGCMIESVEGLENASDIAAVDGVDLLYLGMSDLLISMAKPGRYQDDDLVDALDRVIDATRTNGKYAGCGGAPTVELQAEAVRRGAQFLTTRADVNLMQDGASQWVARLSEELASLDRRDDA